MTDDHPEVQVHERAAGALCDLGQLSLNDYDPRIVEKRRTANRRMRETWRHWNSGRPSNHRTPSPQQGLQYDPEVADEIV